MASRRRRRRSRSATVTSWTDGEGPRSPSPGARAAAGSQAAAFQQAKSRPVQQERHQPWHAIELLEDGADLVARQHDGQVLGPLGPDDGVEPRQLDAEHLAITADPPMAAPCGGKGVVSVERKAGIEQEAPER